MIMYAKFVIKCCVNSVQRKVSFCLCWYYLQGRSHSLIFLISYFTIIMHLIFSLFHLKNNFDICFLLDFVTMHEDVIANDEASTKLKSAVHSFLEKSFEVYS